MRALAADHRRVVRHTGAILLSRALTADHRRVVRHTGAVLLSRALAARDGLGNGDTLAVDDVGVIAAQKGRHVGHTSAILLVGALTAENDIAWIGVRDACAILRVGALAAGRWHGVRLTHALALRGALAALHPGRVGHALAALFVGVIAAREGSWRGHADAVLGNRALAARRRCGDGWALAVDRLGAVGTGRAGRLDNADARLLTRTVSADSLDGHAGALLLAGPRTAGRPTRFIILDACVEEATGRHGDKGHCDRRRPVTAGQWLVGMCHVLRPRTVVGRILPSGLQDIP